MQKFSVRWPLRMTCPALTCDYVDRFCLYRTAAADLPLISIPEQVYFFIVYLHYESVSGVKWKVAETGVFVGKHGIVP